MTMSSGMCTNTMLVISFLIIVNVGNPTVCDFEWKVGNISYIVLLRLHVLVVMDPYISSASFK